MYLVTVTFGSSHTNWSAFTREGINESKSSFVSPTFRIVL